MKQENTGHEEFIDSSGDEDMNKYSVMRNNLSEIPMGSRINNLTPSDTLGKVPEEEEKSEEEPLKAHSPPKGVKFDDHQTTQEEKEQKKPEYPPRHSARPTSFLSKAFLFQFQFFVFI